MADSVLAGYLQACNHMSTRASMIPASILTILAGMQRYMHTSIYDLYDKVECNVSGSGPSHTLREDHMACRMIAILLGHNRFTHLWGSAWPSTQLSNHILKPTHLHACRWRTTLLHWIHLTHLSGSAQPSTVQS